MYGNVLFAELAILLLKIMYMLQADQQRDFRRVAHDFSRWNAGLGIFSKLTLQWLKLFSKTAFRIDPEGCD